MIDGGEKAHESGQDHRHPSPTCHRVTNFKVGAGYSQAECLRSKEPLGLPGGARHRLGDNDWELRWHTMHSYLLQRPSWQWSHSSDQSPGVVTMGDREMLVSWCVDKNQQNPISLPNNLTNNFCFEALFEWIINIFYPLASAPNRKRETMTKIYGEELQNMGRRKESEVAGGSEYRKTKIVKRKGKESTEIDNESCWRLNAVNVINKCSQKSGILCAQPHTSMQTQNSILFSTNTFMQI